jgi:signal transduction histidine kinase
MTLTDRPETERAADEENLCGENELRTLVLAPLGNDGPLTCDFLEAHGLTAECCRTATELCSKLDQGAGALLVAEETLNASSTAGLGEALQRQPPWSDIPVLIVTSDGRLGKERSRRLGVLGPSANITLLERPFRPDTLVRAVAAALRARRRQYQVRDLLDELRNARDTAERANRAKDDFLATLSHELRTPLNPVLLLASEAALDPEMPPTIRRDFEMIARNVELEAHLIDDLLDLTRIARGKLVLELHPLNLHATLHDALTAIESELKGRHLTLHLDLQAAETQVLGDTVRLQQVVWNILRNAVKFTPDFGAIRIATRNPASSGRIVVDVTDDGIGMTPEEIASAFNAFAQGEHASRGSTQRFGGLGLGLAISRMLLELHGGAIRATSRGRDQGATFSIELPLAANKTASTVAAADATPSNDRVNVNHSPSPSGPKSVLLVEDHEPTRSSLTRLLLRRGYTVTSTGSIAEARAAAVHRNFDLLISDLGLPDGDGCELMRDLRPHFARSIALSGYGMERDIEHSKTAGFGTHLVKPLTIQSLDRALSDLFSSRS